MQVRYKILMCVGKALLNQVGGVLGDVLVDVLPDAARAAWDWWSEGNDADARLAEVQELAQASPGEVRSAVQDIVSGIAADQPAEVRQALTTYLTQVPVSLRQTLRRPADPSGRSVAAGLLPQSAGDLLAFLPTRMPRLKVGDRPLAGVDLELAELLGVGGFGEVWRARNPRVEGMPSVALKFCLDPAAKDRLLHHEAKTLAHVMRHGKHPGIVQLQNTYFSAEPPCLQYEYVNGGNLTTLIRESAKRPGGPDIEQAARMMLALSEVVGYAHHLEPAIVHRDLKPANILVQRVPTGVRLRIADFGIGGVAAAQALRQTAAHGTTEGGRMTSALRGAHTPLYASPQQAEGQAADPRDDVYSLGVIWYQMLTGDLSVGRPGGTRWAQRLAERGLPQSQLDLLTACFEDRPEDRLCDAGVLAQGLALSLEKKGTSATTSTPGRAAPKKPAETQKIAPVTQVAKKPPASPEPQAGDKAPAGPSSRRSGVLLGAGAGVTVLVVVVGLAVALRGPKPAPVAGVAPPTSSGEKAAPADPKEKPPDVQTGVERAREALQRNESDQALANLDEALRQDPANVAARVLRARIWNLRKEYAKAIQDCEVALKAAPKETDAYEQRAIAYAGMGEHAKVVADATEALRLLGEAPAAPRSSSPVLGGPGGGGSSGPVAAGAKSRLLPLYLLRAQASRGLGKYNPAIEDCAKVLELDPSNLNALNQRGIAYANLGNYDQAITDYDKVLQQEPRLAAVHFNRALALGGVNRRDDPVLARQAPARCSSLLAWSCPDLCPPHRSAASAGPSAPGAGLGGLPGAGPSSPPGVGPKGDSRKPGTGAGESKSDGASPPAGFDGPPGGGPSGTGFPGMPAGGGGKSSGKTASRGGMGRGDLFDTPTTSVLPSPLPDLPAPSLNSLFPAPLVGPPPYALSSPPPLPDTTVPGGPGSGLPPFGPGGLSGGQAAGTATEVWTYYGCKGMYQEAETGFSAAIECDPSLAMAWFNRGWARLKMRNYADAAADFSQGIAADKDFAPGYYYLGLVLLTAGDSARAQASFSEALRREPGYALALKDRALAWASLGKPEEADRDLLAAWRAGGPALALSFNQAWAYLLRGTAPDAVAVLNRLVEQGGNYPLVYYARGYANAARGEAELARTDFDQALKLKGTLHEVYVLRGRLAELKGDVTKAEADYTTAVQSNPSVSVALVARGFLRAGEREVDTSRLKQGVEDYSTALGEPATNTAETRLYRAVAYFRLREFDNAVTDCNWVLERSPSAHVPALLIRGTARSAKGDPEGAIADFGQVLTLDKNNQLALLRRGDVYLAQSRADEALKDYNAVLALDARNAEAIARRGLVQIMKKNYRGAIAEMTKALSADPKNWLYYAVRAQAYKVGGDLAKARADLLIAEQLRQAVNP